jgi:hypothetical protein
MEIVFTYLDELSAKINVSKDPSQPRRRIGYKPDTD